MPVAPSPGSPFPTVNSVLNVARARVNDMINSVDGDILTNDAPFTQTYLSASWKWYQDRCSNAGIELVVAKTVLMGIPARATQDTAYESFVSTAGCGDGLGEYSAPALPTNFASLLSIKRRQSGTQDDFCLMREGKDGLPDWLDASVYELRGQSIYHYGDQYAQDWKVKYSTYYDDLNIGLPQQVIPMLGCEDCLGARIAYEYASTRGASQAPQMAQWAEDAFSQTMQRVARRKQRMTIRRRPYSGMRYTNNYPVH